MLEFEKFIMFIYIILYYNNFDSCLGNEMSFSESSSQFPKPRPQFVGTHAPPVHGFMSLNRIVPTEIWFEIFIDCEFCLKFFDEVYQSFLEPSVRAAKEKVL